MEVSVIIPAYNAEDTISDTLNSLIDQTFQNWEAIVINDGSTDNTEKIISDFMLRDKRIILFTQKNKGESGARNAGIELAKNDWMIFLDSDDWILPEHLKKLVDKVYCEPHLDAAYCGWTYVTPDGQFIFESVSHETGDLFNQHAGYCFSVIHTYLIKSSLVIEAKGFDESLQTCSDWDMWQRIARTGVHFGSIPEVLAVYRIRDGSATRNGFQLFTDGLSVINRGHSSDHRVLKPDKSHIYGSHDKEITKRKYELLCACAGYLIGGKKDAIPLFNFLEKESCLNLNAFSIALCLFRHTIISSAKPVSKWKEAWNDYSKSVNIFLESLESASGTPNLEKKSIRIINNLLNSYDSGTGIIGKTQSLKSKFLLKIYNQPAIIRKFGKVGKKLLNISPQKISF